MLNSNINLQDAIATFVDGAKSDDHKTALNSVLISLVSTTNTYLVH